MPAVGDVTFVDDLSPAAMYPHLVGTAALDPENPDSIVNNLDLYGSKIVSVASNSGATTGGRPYGKISPSPSGTAQAHNSVRDTGQLEITDSGPGTAAQLTIKNADFSLRTYPTQNATGSAIPGDAAYAISFHIRVHTPVEVIREFGSSSGSNGTRTLRTFNQYSDLHIEGFDPQNGDVQGSDDQPGNSSADSWGAAGPNIPSWVKPAGFSDWHWNDYRTTTPNVSLAGSFTKYFVGVTGLPGNMTAQEFWPSGPSTTGEGPPGGATRRSGGITVAPEQSIVSLLAIGGTDNTLPANVSVVACDVWDNTKLHLEARNVPAGNATARLVPSNGAPVWINGYNNVATADPNVVRSAVSALEVPEMVIEYSPLSAATVDDETRCRDSEGPWLTDPTDATFANDPVLEAQGVYTGVGRVRVHLVLPEPAGTNISEARAYVAIGMRVADSGYPSGTILPNWATNTRINFSTASMTEVLAQNSATWQKSAYRPETHDGAAGDRLILAHAQARIDKQVRKGDTGAFSSTPPNVTGGDLVQYRLSPSLTSGAQAPGILKDVWVEDCLPASQSYDTASVTPAIVSPGSTPADAERPDCASGETYIRWVLPDQEVNTVIEPIILSVEVSPTAADGVYTNTVVVWAEDDASTLAQRSDQAQIQIANIAGIKLEKEALTPVVQVNRAGQATDELNKWAVRLSNTLPASEQSGVTNPDVIDVLPKQGVAGTDFTGTFEFVEATVTQGGAQTRILYTKTANVSANPQDPSNGAAGATTWCDAPAGGTRVSGVNGCPASAAEVTGLRIQRSGAYLSGDVIEIELSMVGVGNRGGDVYVNRAMAAADGLDNTVGPIRRPEVAIESSIGDYTWWDLNRNGIQDSFQGSPEQPAEGIVVRLSGTDDLGNAVSIDAETDDSGAYLFRGLRSSDDDGYTVTFVAPDGSEFTQQFANGADGDQTNDSNADTETGEADPLVLGRDTHDRTVDAGFLPNGGLQINKTVAGAGAGEYAKDDTLVFDVVCTFDDGSGADPVAVFDGEVSLSVDGADAVTSDVLGPLPAYASCTVTETDSGSADEAAGPVTVTVPWDSSAQTSGTVTASLTNFYSAGSVEVTKKLDGDRDAIEQAKNKVFEILVTCQIEETDADGETLRADVYSGSVLIKGGQTKYLVDENDEARVLPLGTKCFGEEVDDGGAVESVVDRDSFENAAIVTDGSPDELQVLTISAVNTFEDPEVSENCEEDCIPNLGGTLLGGVLLLGAGLMLIGGAAMMLRDRRRREEDEEFPIQMS
ncbi:SdrD B-like domain-containing protein [Leucobacter soli]|nr:SdrD B-like domain-containing protein [Leucobacter soli]